MKRLLLFGLLLALVAAVGDAQTPQALARMTVAVAWDLDGEAADDDQIVAGPDALADSTTYTIDAQPDICRLVDITVVDADSSISAGALTVTGTGCLGEAKSCAFTFAAGGSGVKTLTCTDGFGAYLGAVSDVSTGVLTGEGGGDTVEVGYTSNSVNGWPIYGRLGSVDPMGRRGVDPGAWFDVPLRITTSGVASTTVTGVNATDDAFAQVSVGDLLIVQIANTSYERKVTAKASADSITVSGTLNIPAAGTTYRFKKFYFSTNPNDMLYMPVSGWQTALFNWSVDSNTNTGGVVMLLECTSDRAEFPGARWVTIQTTTVASAATQANTSESVNLNLLPYSYCRMGFRFGTGDDDDTGIEDINLTVDLMK